MSYEPSIFKCDLCSIWIICKLDSQNEHLFFIFSLIILFTPIFIVFIFSKCCSVCCGKFTKFVEHHLRTCGIISFEKLLELQRMVSRIFHWIFILSTEPIRVSLYRASQVSEQPAWYVMNLFKLTECLVCAFFYGEVEAYMPTKISLTCK